ncbi:MAG: oligopeptide transporter, OPT family [Alphaproteobacteria bacterium]|nr:oligopeptide transporter, OPT family [Alphaproteobacteria bacterium]
MTTKEFTPYISANSNVPEFTWTSVLAGCLLAIVFGAANAYLGLRAGMTVSASIPAAVIAMGTFKFLKRKNAILESNLVQTIGSAGESLAAGIIFTVPVLFLWANEGKCDLPSMLTIISLALLGGVLGVLFMIPLRKALIVKEHNTLPYPEGTACAEVLLSGERKGAASKIVFLGMGFSAIVKMITGGLKLIPDLIHIPLKSLQTLLSFEVSPSFLGVGYICGIKISSYLFAGGFLAWFFAIPLITIFSPEMTISNFNPKMIWSTYIRYIGAGALVTGGLISLFKSLPLIINTFIQSIKSVKSSSDQNNDRTNQDLSFKFLAYAIVGCILAILFTPSIPVGTLGSLLIVAFGFVFATVSSRIVGLIGSSNNPVSGMSIAALLISTILLKMSGHVGISGMLSAISIGSIVCIVSAMAGDTSQDLKTGYLLGATPKKQQIGEILGVICSALTIGFVILLLNKAWGFGSENLSAPQATLMKMVIEGVMSGNLPWNLIFIGASLAICVEILRIPVLPFAIGFYLPFNISSTIMIGGIIRYFIDRKYKTEENSTGILYCSGMIAGEGLMGILLAGVMVLNWQNLLDFSKYNVGIVGSLFMLFILAYSIFHYAKKK